MNCVSCVVIFFYLLELILETQVSNTMKTVGISSNDKLLLMLMFKVSSISMRSKASTPLIHYRTDDVVIQVAPLHECVNWQCWRRQFSTIVFIKSNSSAIDRLVVVKFHINIANRWLFIIQRNIMAIILFIKSF